MDKDKINTLIHQLSPIGQTFHNYAHLLENDFFGVSKPTLKKMCQKCAKLCLELRNIIIQEVE